MKTTTSELKIFDNNNAEGNGENSNCVLNTEKRLLLWTASSNSQNYQVWPSGKCSVYFWDDDDDDDEDYGDGDIICFFVFFLLWIH